MSERVNPFRLPTLMEQFGGRAVAGRQRAESMRRNRQASLVERATEHAIPPLHVQEPSTWEMVERCESSLSKYIPREPTRVREFVVDQREAFVKEMARTCAKLEITRLQGIMQHDGSQLDEEADAVVLAGGEFRRAQERIDDKVRAGLNRLDAAQMERQRGYRALRAVVGRIEELREQIQRQKESVERARRYRDMLLEVAEDGVPALRALTDPGGCEAVDTSHLTLALQEMQHSIQMVGPQLEQLEQYLEHRVEASRAVIDAVAGDAHRASAEVPVIVDLAQVAAQSVSTPLHRPDTESARSARSAAPAVQPPADLEGKITEANSREGEQVLQRVGELTTLVRGLYTRLMRIGAVCSEPSVLLAGLQTELSRLEARVATMDPVRVAKKLAALLEARRTRARKVQRAAAEAERARARETALAKAMVVRKQTVGRPLVPRSTLATHHKVVCIRDPEEERLQTLLYAPTLNY